VLAGSVPCLDFVLAAVWGALTFLIDRACIHALACLSRITEDFAMKVQIAAAAFVLGCVPALAQMTGVSHPDPAVVTANDDSATPAPASTGDATARRPLTAKPSAGTPATTAAPGDEAYGSFVPYTGPLLKAPVSSGATAVVENPDEQIVTSVPEREGELREGTLLRVVMKEGISTTSTMPGT
jgi:hypothetical protein